MEITTVYKVVEKCSYVNFSHNRRFDVGCFEVERKSYTLLELLSLGWDRDYIKKCVFEDEREANEKALKYTLEKLGKVYEQLYDKEKK